MDPLHGRRSVHGWGGGWKHRDVAETTRAGCLKSGVEAFLRFFARFPKVDLSVDPTGADHAPIVLQDLASFRRLK